MLTSRRRPSQRIIPVPRLIMAKDAHDSLIAAAHRAQAEQSKRFRDAVQELVDAGELSPTEADERFEKAVNRIVKHSGKDD